jgi:hypothetical protein
VKRPPRKPKRARRYVLRSVRAYLKVSRAERQPGTVLHYVKPRADVREPDELKYGHDVERGPNLKGPSHGEE